MKRIIGFTGHKLNGKTTASNYLMQRIINESEIPVKVERINMKDSIIEEMKENFPVTLEGYSETYDRTVPELFSTKPDLMRKLMQDYGLMRRREDPEYWVNRWCERVKRSSADFIIVDDIRFINEFDIVQRVGGKVYKIIREGVVNDDYHATEREIELIDCTTISAKTKDELFARLDSIMI